MKKPPLVAWITLLVLVAVVGDRLTRSASAAGTPAAAVQGALEPQPGATRAAEPPAPAPAAGTSTTSSVDELARLAARRQLNRVGDQTYLDSLLATTDSVVRRWPDRGLPLKVAIIEGGSPGYEPRMADLVREALAVWQSAGVGVRFALVTDTANADITVHWIDRFDFDRAGQTDLTWDQLGHVRRAVISLAIRTSAGVPLPDSALRSVAVHETGHALGLPHSADSSDVMFPATRTGTLTERDRKTAILLYQLPPGPLREQETAAAAR